MALLVVERCWKMHACGQAKWICIEHWIERVEELVDSTEHWTTDISSLRHSWLHHRMLALEAHRLLDARRDRWLIEIGDVMAWMCRLVEVLIVDHVRLRIVLLFCTHGINLGRT